MSEQDRETLPQPLEARVRILSRRLAGVEEQIGRQHSGAECPADLVELLTGVRHTLKDSEDRYQRLVGRVGAVVVELAPDGRVLSLNDAITRATGYRPAELIGTPWWDKLFPGEYRRELWRLYRRLQKGDVSGWDIRLESKHRTPVTLEVSSANVYAHNRLQTLVLFGSDITAERALQRELERTREELQEMVWVRTDQLERINAELQIEIIEREQFESALRKSEERFRRAVGNIPALVALYDAEQRIRFINSRALSLWELSERDVIGSTDEELLPPSVTDTYLPALRRALRTRRSQSAEAHMGLHGRVYTFLFNFVPLLNRNGDVEELLAIGYDVTERRRIEEDLRLRHRELQTLNRISEIALTRRSLQAAYEDIVEAVRDATEFPAVAIEIYDAAQQRLLLQAGTGVPDMAPERKPDETAGQILRSRRPLIEHRLEGVGGLGPGFQVLLSVPMVVRDTVLGLISIATPDRPEAEERTIQLLEAIGNYVAVMTERQRAEEALRESEAQRERAEKFSSIMAVRTGLDGVWLRTTPRLSEWLGYSEPELRSMRVQDVLHPDDRGATEDAFRRLQRGEIRSIDLEKRYIARDGRVLWGSVNTSVIPDAEGRPLHFLTYIRDITERKHAEEELRLAARVFESSAEAIMILDARRRIVNVNRAFSEITGFARESALGHTPRLLSSKRHPDEFFRHMWEMVERYGGWQGEVWGRRRDGQVFPALLNMGEVRDDQNRVINYVGIFRDITEIKRSQEELERLANYDSLTGLPNRNLFYDRLSHGLDRARRARSRLAVLFVDLDNFKVVNDSLGHDAGDELLKQVAERLRRSVRSEDTIARIGGDEFIVLLEEAADITDVADAARRINESLFIPVDLGRQKMDITGSIGISIYPEDGENIGTLLKNADTAMYVAKEEGRNNYRFFTRGMNEKTIERLTMARSLRLALENEEFFLVYQPMMAVKSGRTEGLEAAIRWNHPELGVLRPDRFIPLAEATGMINAIGRWVLRQVCEQIRAWTDAGVVHRRVAINVSAYQFKQVDMAEEIIGAVREFGIDASDLEVELTESAVMQDPEEARRILERLKQAGVHIAIDDFGTGYSSLSYLKRFPIDRLKIDMSFVHDVASDPDDAAISNAIILMAHSLNVAVVAEGVETQEQMDFFASRGCDEIQGFWFSQPLSVDQVGCYDG